MWISVSSSAFADGGMIPGKYTAGGADISPPLRWEGVPGGTVSIAIICDDPDAPMGTWVHWVIWNLPGDIGELAEDVPATDSLDNGAKEGTTDFGRIGWGGPAPPSGVHRYYFKVYALDCMLELKAGAVKDQLLEAMDGHVLAEGQMMGRYKRQ